MLFSSSIGRGWRARRVFWFPTDGLEKDWLAPTGLFAFDPRYMSLPGACVAHGYDGAFCGRPLESIPSSSPSRASGRVTVFAHIRPSHGRAGTIQDSAKTGDLMQTSGKDLPPGLGSCYR